MIIYNVTIHVTWAVHDAWLQWMKEVHIAEVINTGMFFDYQILRLLEVDEVEGPTYAVQYYSKSKETYNEYIQEFSDALRKKGTDQWGNQFIAFRSVMQVVE
jgi:Domain of unknown function (DUF4286)